MAAESKEAIVIYSEMLQPLQTLEQRFPQGYGNNIVPSRDGRSFVDTNDVYGWPIQPSFYPNESIALSKSYIETLDLLCEGEIEGPLTGKYTYSGNISNTGWSSAIFSGYNTPQGYSAAEYSWLRSLYWNEVPVLSDRGQFNFQNVQAVSTNGLQNGVVLENLLDENTSSRSIGERLRFGSDNSKIYRILNRNCKGCIINIKFSSLFLYNPNNGETKRTDVRYNVSYRPIFTSNLKVTQFSAPILEAVFGKIQSAGGYVRSTRVEFNTTSFLGNNSQVNNVAGGFLDNADFLGWEIKIERLTEDSTNNSLSNISVIDSLTELYGSQLTYPNSAIVKTKFDAEYFASVPERAFECNLLKVKIPGNYNPILRTYSGAGFATTNGYWNGEFAENKQWTSNPAWCFYDLLTNKRYGLGRYIDNISVDKFNLYDISQYCDQLVPDGEGGLEPRFTCNTWIASREDAFTVINDLASVFRAMTYYANGQVYTVQDSKKSPRVMFTNTNVEDGDFVYSSTSKRTRQSVAIVSYINPRDFYRPSIEYVEDIDAIRKYGVREYPLTAFACTSRGQAIRLGRWALLSNNIENETIQFVAGIEAATLRPGDIFKVIDQNKKVKRYGGRVSSIATSGSGATVTLDSVIPSLESSLQYKMSVLTPSYYYDATQVSGLNSSDISNIRRSFIQEFLFSGNSVTNSETATTVQLPTGFNTTGYNISGHPVWSIELGPLSSNDTGIRYFFDPSEDSYRVINISEADVNRYNIVGLKYWDDKFNEIDSGILYQRSQTESLNRRPSSPRDLNLYVTKITNSISSINYAFIVDNFNFINNYRVFMSNSSFGLGVPGQQYLVNILPNNLLQSSLTVNSSGNYDVRVYSFNELDNIYSDSYAGGSVSVYSSPSITDISIGTIQTY